MKLRTRITLIASAVIWLVGTISDAMIWASIRRTLISEAAEKTQHELAVIRMEYQNYDSYSPSVLSDVETAYFFKKLGDDYIICLRGQDILYNRTTLTMDEIRDYKPVSVPEESRSGEEWENGYYLFPTDVALFLPKMGQLQKSGRSFLIAETTLPNQITLYRLTDLSPVSERLRLLALGMLVVLVGLSVPAGAVLYLLLRRTLRPLQALSERAKRIAAGAYDERAIVSRPDEVRQLAQDFNLMADAVEEKISALAESEERKTMFMADFSHELKTPLTAISGYAQTLRTVKLDAEERDEALGYIHSESRRLDRLAKKMMRLMALDRTEALTLTPIETETLLNAVITTCRPSARDKGIALSISECSGTVTGDFDLLHDALCNLTENAIKASKHGQTVELSAMDDLLSVRDSGCGIPSEEIKHLTDAFYMVDKSRSRESGGAGLGLSIVAQINRLHGIRMEIESTPDMGTTVKLHFTNDTPKKG